MKVKHFAEVTFHFRLGVSYHGFPRTLVHSLKIFIQLIFLGTNMSRNFKFLHLKSVLMH